VLGFLKNARRETLPRALSFAGKLFPPDRGQPGNSTPTETFADGEGCTLHIDDGTARTITWTMVDEWIGGSAPTLPTTGYAVVELWKVNTTLYAAYLGDLS